MTRNAPRLTTALLDSALAVPNATEAPGDLYGSISAGIRLTRQRPAPAARRITDSFVALPQSVRLVVTTLLLLALLAGIAVVGAQLQQPRPLDDSLTFRGNVARTGIATGPGPGGAMAIAFQTTLPGQIVTSPAIVDGVAYVGAADGLLRAFDLQRGVEEWSTDIGVTWSSPSVGGDLIVVGTENRDLVALDPRTGNVVWQVSLGGFAAGSPAIDGDRLYVATSSERSRGSSAPGATGAVLAVDLGTHQIAWQEDLPGPSTHSIAVHGSILVVPTDVGIAVAFDTATARELWRFPTQAFADTPVIAGGTVFLAGLDLEGTRGILWAVDLESGRERWRHRRPSGQTIVAPVVDPEAGIVYAGTVDGDVIALRADDGAEIWTRHLGAVIGSSPTKAGDVLYVATNGGIVALDVARGEVLRTLAIDGIPSSPTVAGQYLVVGTQSGNLYVVAGFRVGLANPSSADATAVMPSASPPSTPNASPAPLVEIWARTSQDLGLRDPFFFINAAPDGRLWIADSGRGRFVIVAPDGTIVDTWQPTGDAALDLVQPDTDGWGAVAFLPDGGFFVADSDHQRILRFDADRKRVGSFGSFGSGPGQFISPFGITVGPDGLVYVVDDSSCRVEVFEQSGTYLRTLAGSPDSFDRCTNNVVVDRDGTVYVASGGRGAPWQITAFAPDGTILRQIGKGILSEPVLLAPGANGTLYATDGTERLDVFDMNGDLISWWSARDFGLAVGGPEGDLYVAGLDGILRRYSFPAPDKTDAP